MGWSVFWWLGGVFFVVCFCLGVGGLLVGFFGLGFFFGGFSFSFARVSLSNHIFMADCKLTIACHMIAAELKEATRLKGPHIVAFQDYIHKVLG